MFGHKTNRALFAFLLLAAALPAPAMTPALLSGKLGLMAAVAEGARLPLQVGVWRYPTSSAPTLLGNVHPEPALLGWVEPEAAPIISAETLALPSDELLAPVTPVSLPSFRTVFPLFPPPSQGQTHLTGGLSPVPEPSTWMLLIGGFLFVGHALRTQARARSRALAHV
ncbi:PEPxxWA-CTERM sorting domain-containing protein [Phenylobacterium sp. LH3H17]|uniref:PEPxxWA-CTERM sorting domain-containing protein n=1 Tax=Phenylobacterium sp. LH3H17 TaxID=2903901 RepID=UPI0020C9DE7D|nr:PEPxxWA-CTERM sorting domain-containing protein [Phenylobacterium sp. LH3H17]UTP40968.1 PEPxxWA-CTERM sorting domain-containing protein [Phenylobacterium sp. LH3H17]